MRARRSASWFKTCSTRAPIFHETSSGRRTDALKWTRTYSANAPGTGPEPVIVISHKENQILFGGGNSVGRNIQWNNQQFRVIGVLEEWSPQPKFYDLNNGPFDVAEDAARVISLCEQPHSEIEVRGGPLAGATVICAPVFEPRIFLALSISPVSGSTIAIFVGGSSRVSQVK